MIRPLFLFLYKKTFGSDSEGFLLLFIFYFTGSNRLGKNGENPCPAMQPHIYRKLFFCTVQKNQVAFCLCFYLCLTYSFNTAGLYRIIIKSRNLVTDNDLPLILNHNYFLKAAVPGLTKEIAEDSVYQYLEQTLHMTIVNSKRIMTVEKMTQIDEKYLMMDSRDYNCMAVISSQTYNSDGVMFEYTQSRHRPDYFRFYDNAVRKPV